MYNSKALDGGNYLITNNLDYPLLIADNRSQFLTVYLKEISISPERKRKLLEGKQMLKQYSFNAKTNFEVITG